MSSSIHDKLKRVRKPRRPGPYKIPGDPTDECELPFVVGVIGDFSGHPTKKLTPLRDRNFVYTDRDNINDVMKKMTPGLNLQVENTLNGDGSELGVNLKFESMDDFEPANVARQVEPLQKLLEKRDKLRELLTDVDRSPAFESVLEDVLQNARTKAPHENAFSLQDAIKKGVDTNPIREGSKVEQLMQTLVDEVLLGTVTWVKDVTRSIENGMAAIDAVISKQLAAIMHAPEFQKLEGSWRGLHYLVMNSETNNMLKLRVLNCGKSELLKDVEKAVEFDQSELFKKIYSSEFGMPGGEPYGALIGDFEFTKHPDDVNLLEKVSQVAAAAFCPVISAASPELFGFREWTEMAKPQDLESIFSTPDYSKWRTFRESEDARFVSLTLPRTLARLPYGANTKPIEEFGYEEVPLGANGEIIGIENDQHCWMNTAYVVGVRLTEAFATYGWCTRICGADSGGKVEGLPTHIFKTDYGELDRKCPTEVAITERRESELNKLGFLPLLHCKNAGYSVFFGGQTCHKPQQYDRAEKTANAAIAARLPYIMATSRIAHYLKVMARNAIGSFKKAEDVEHWMQRWIANYVSADPNPSEEQRARYPLREARVEVEEIPGEPGSYIAKVLMRPWLEMEELSAALSMVVELPQQAS